MNKAEKKFRIYAILVIFVLLTVLLAVINVVNFTMAAEDADRITQALSERQGSFEQNGPGFGDMQIRPDKDTQNMPDMQAPPDDTKPDFDKGDFRFGPMGPDSPEMNASLRYFTVSFSEKGENAQTVAFNISAVTEEEAQEWAKELLKEKTGWTRGTYRYRVYKKDGVKYVTVIDQGRELLPSYRILIISAIGEALCLVIAWFVLLIIGRKIYAPIEEADRKQKNFITKANKEFRIPLTVISGNMELTERKYGPDDQTRSTRRQLEKLNGLVEKLGTTGIFEDDNEEQSEIPVSDYLKIAIEAKQGAFSAKGVELMTEIEPDVKLKGDPAAIKQTLDELADNAAKFSLTHAAFTLKNENGHVVIEEKNDAELPDGQYEQAFDRFTTLDNAKDNENGAGLGLSYVKETVKAHNGRASAEVKDGEFIIRITL